jgi:hypothetical protein
MEALAIVPGPEFTASGLSPAASALDGLRSRLRSGPELVEHRAAALEGAPRGGPVPGSQDRQADQGLGLRAERGRTALFEELRRLRRVPGKALVRAAPAAAKADIGGKARLGDGRHERPALGLWLSTQS